MLDFVIFFINQVVYKYKLIPLFFQRFKDIRQRLGGMLGVVVEKYDRAVFYLARNQFINTVRRGGTLPVEGVNVRYKSKDYMCKRV